MQPLQLLLLFLCVGVLCVCDFGQVCKLRCFFGFVISFCGCFSYYTSRVCLSQVDRPSPGHPRRIALLVSRLTSCFLWLGYSLLPKRLDAPVNRTYCCTSIASPKGRFEIPSRDWYLVPGAPSLIFVVYIL